MSLTCLISTRQISEITWPRRRNIQTIVCSYLFFFAGKCINKIEINAMNELQASAMLMHQNRILALVSRFSESKNICKLIHQSNSVQLGSVCRQGSSPLSRRMTVPCFYKSCFSGAREGGWHHGALLQMEVWQQREKRRDLAIYRY